VSSPDAASPQRHAPSGTPNKAHSYMPSSRCKASNTTSPAGTSLNLGRKLGRACSVACLLGIEATAQSLDSEFVIQLALVFARQDVVGSRDLLELFLGVVVARIDAGWDLRASLRYWRLISSAEAPRATPRIA
jgi:hypothetical protein